MLNHMKQSLLKLNLVATWKKWNSWQLVLFLSVGDTLSLAPNGEDGTNWGNEAGVNVLKFISSKRQQRILLMIQLTWWLNSKMVLLMLSNQDHGTTLRTAKALGKEQS